MCHVVEKLWALGHHFHKEGSEELKAWVEELKALDVVDPVDGGDRLREEVSAGAHRLRRRCPKVI